MMILSPVIVLKEAPRKRKYIRGAVMGSLLVFAGLGLIALAASPRDRWD